jgi:hypothetical protein
MAVHSSVTIININEMQPMYASLGLGQIPAGTLADVAVLAVETQLTSNLAAEWTQAGRTSPGINVSSGIMGPWSADVGGTAPTCVVQQLTENFNDWSLPNDQSAISSIASEITENIAVNGGLPGTFLGLTREGGSEAVLWGVAYTTGVIVDNPLMLGVIYTFEAVLSLDAEADLALAPAGSSAN